MNIQALCFVCLTYLYDIVRLLMSLPSLLVDYHSITVCPLLFIDL